MLEYPWRRSSFEALVALRHPQLAGNAVGNVAGKYLRVPAYRAGNTDRIPEEGFTGLPNHAANDGTVYSLATIIRPKYRVSTIESLWHESKFTHLYVWYLRLITARTRHSQNSSLALSITKQGPE